MGCREIVEGFELIKEERGITGTRKFIEGNDVDGSDILPVIGDPFYDSLLAESGFDNVFCRRIVEVPFAGDNTKVEYTCFYSNDPTDPEQFTGTAVGWEYLPQSAEYSGEYNLIDSPSGWTYYASGTSIDGKAVEVPIPKRVQTSTLKITRIFIGDLTAYKAYIKTANGLLGKVNNPNTPPDTDGVYANYMFTSYSSEPFRNFADALRWRIELIFTYRCPDSTDPTEGWQKILDKSGVWGIPEDANGDRLYAYEDFTPLFA